MIEQSRKLCYNYNNFKGISQTILIRTKVKFMKIYHKDGLNAIEKVFFDEKIRLSDYAKESIFELLSKIGNYEEEGMKILPKILIGRNMEIIFSQIPDHFNVNLGDDDLQGIHIRKILKSLIPLCRNGWYVYVDIQTTKLMYGIFRKFRSPVALDAEQLIFDSKEMYLSNKETGMIYICPQSKTSLLIRSLHSEDVQISSEFKTNEEQDENMAFAMLIADITMLIEKNKDKSAYIKNAMKHIISLFKERVHGTIVLVVNEKYLYPNTYLNGLEIKTNLNIIECIEESLTVESYEAAERYYAITNLLYEFLNVDGITIVNTTGQIIGYNAFYRSEETPMDVIGGARKRTFEGLKRQTDPNIIGVYYQSQDGNIQYARRE